MELNEKKYVEKTLKNYEEKGFTKLDELKNLDKLAKRRATVFAYVFGVIGTLILGLGMTFFLYWTESFFWGFPFAIIGTIMMVISYPIYKRVHKKLKDKYKEEIIELSNSLLEE